MPTKNKCPSIFKKTDRSLHAEIKNRVETLRCRLRTRALEKQKFQQEGTVNREKRMIEKGMAKMQTQTTGVCVAGLPPDGPMDNTHHKSPYFQGTAAVSEKRLQKWRVKEKQVQKANKLFEEELAPFPWQKEEPEPFGQPFSIVMGFLGYDPEQVEKLVEARTPRDRVRPHVKASADTDVFECLRKESLQERRRKQLYMLKSKSLSAFSVQEWQSERVKEYADAMTQPQPLTDPRVYRRIQSAPGETAHVRSSNAWLDSSDGAQLTPLKNPTKELTPPSVKQDNSDMYTPNDNRNLITTSDVPTYPEDKADATGTEANAKIIRPKDATENDMLEASRVTVQKLDETDSSRYSSSSVQPAPHPKTLPKTFVTHQTRFNINQPARDKPRNPNLQRQTIPATQKKTTLITPALETTNGNATQGTLKPCIVPKYQPNRRQEASRSDAGNKQQSPQNSSDHKTNAIAMTKKEIIPLKRVGPAERVTSKNIQLKKDEPNGRVMPKKQILQLKKDEPNDKVTPKKIITLKKDEPDDKVMPKKQILQLQDDHDSSASPMKHLPQWKRHLMMEAPPSLSGAKGAEKVKLVMSKNQRRRELRQLVDDKVGDVHQIIGQEHQRRRESRNNMMKTMRQVQQAVESLNPLPEDPTGQGEEEEAAMVERMRGMGIKGTGVTRRTSVARGEGE